MVLEIAYLDELLGGVESVDKTALRHWLGCGL